MNFDFLWTSKSWLCILQLTLDVCVLLMVLVALIVRIRVVFCLSESIEVMISLRNGVIWWNYKDTELKMILKKSQLCTINCFVKVASFHRCPPSSLSWSLFSIFPFLLHPLAWRKWKARFVILAIGLNMILFVTWCVVCISYFFILFIHFWGVG